MKNVKILVISFAICTSSLFAATVEYPPHNNTKHPVNKTDFEAKKDKHSIKTDIKATKSSENVVYTAANNNKLYNLNYNNKELLFKEMQLKAIKNYKDVMPDIIGKE